MADIDFDEVLKKIGEKGKFQTRLFYLICIPATLPAIFLSCNQIFVSAVPDHWCKIPELENNTLLSPDEIKSLSIPFTIRSDGSKEFSKCEMYDIDYGKINKDSEININWNHTNCKYGWNYDKSYYDETLATKLNLVCDQSWWIATSNTCFYTVSLFGMMIIGMISDRFGRKAALLLIIIWYNIFSIATAFSSDYVTYTILRSLSGFIHPSTFQVPFILGIESMGPKYRTYAGMMICVLFAVAMAFLASITFVIRHWKTLLFFTSFPFLPLLSYKWLISESPRWLLCKGKINEAEKIVQKIAKTNGYTIKPNFLQTFQDENNLLEKNEDLIIIENEEDNIGVFDILLKRPILRCCILVITFEWIANALIYNGFLYNSGNLGIRDQTSFLIGAAVELPGYLFAWWAMDRFGRRFTMFITMLVGGVACVCSVFVPPKLPWITFTLAMFGRFGISASFAIIYVFAGELLPTVVRARCMASATLASNAGLLLMPSIIHLANYWRVLPLLIFGTLSITGAFLTRLLPETLNRPLPQTLKDGELLHDKKNLKSYFAVPNPFIVKQ